MSSIFGRILAVTDTWSLSPNSVPLELLRDLKKGKIGQKKEISCFYDPRKSAGKLGASDVLRIVQACNEGNVTDLKKLSLTGNDIGAKGVRLLSGMSFSKLEELSLTSNNIGYYGIEALSRISWPNLKNLGLCDNNLGLSGVQALSRVDLPKLEILGLARNNIGDAGVKSLSGIGFKLRFLNLDRNNITAKGISYLKNMNCSVLNSLHLINNPIGNLGEEELKKIEAPHIYELHITVGGLYKSGYLTDSIREEMKKRKTPLKAPSQARSVATTSSSSEKADKVVTIALSEQRTSVMQGEEGVKTTIKIKVCSHPSEDSTEFAIWQRLVVQLADLLAEEGPREVDLLGSEGLISSGPSKATDSMST